LIDSIRRKLVKFIINPKVLTKTSLILGLGETDSEIEETMDDLIANKVDILTLGQYSDPP